MSHWNYNKTSRDCKGASQSRQSIMMNKGTDDGSNLTLMDMSRSGDKVANQPSVTTLAPSSTANLTSPMESSGTYRTVSRNWNMCREDISPSRPQPGEKSSDMLVRLYGRWSEELTPSFRPPAVTVAGPMRSAEFNLQQLRELYPISPLKGRKLKVMGLAVKSVSHIRKKSTHT